MIRRHGFLAIDIYAMSTPKTGVLIPPKRGCNIINPGIFNFGGSSFKRNIFGEKVVQTYTLEFISLKVWILVEKCSFEPIIFD